MFKRKDRIKADHHNGHIDNNNSALKSKKSNGVSNNGHHPQQQQEKGTELAFHCQLAHGSANGSVSGFSSVRELYDKIAEQFDIPPSEILFCTLNTYKIDMKNLLAGQIGLDDFIFAHRKGQPKEVEVVKEEEALGLTITDNGAGYAFIKRIKDNSVIDRNPHIQIGDHIERLNGDLMVGKRHHEVARMLKCIPVGESFTIRLIEPLQSGFTSIAPKSGAKKTNRSYGSGMETLRFKSGGNAEIAKKDDVMDAAVEKINVILENYLGINDAELATQIWEKSKGQMNSMDFADAIEDSDIKEFCFGEDLIIELWGAVTDARDGRLK